MRRAPLLTAALLLAGCSVSRGVRPLGKGVTAVTASAGGPLTDYAGGVKPLPIATVGASHGLTDTVDLHGAVNASSLAFFGLFGAEVGAGWGFLEQRGARPALMGDLTVDLFAGDRSSGPPEGGARVFTELDLRASWAWSPREHLVYTGPTGFFQPAPFRVVPAWSLGHQFSFDHLDLVTEARWLAPFDDNDAVTIDYGGIGQAGAISLQLGARVRFGGGS